MDVNYNDVGSAQHYQKDRIDTMHKLEAIWGTFQVMTYCEMSAFCYRMRAGRKIGNDPLQDITKAEWFETRAEFLRMKLEKNEGKKSLKIDIETFRAPIEPEFLEMLDQNKLK